MGGVRDDEIVFPEDSERQWRAYLQDFRATAWPMFEENGFTFPQAFMVWQLQKMDTTMWQLIEAFADDDGPTYGTGTA